MAANPSTRPPALVIDSTVLIAICSKELSRHTPAHTELTSYASLGHEFFPPGHVVADCLYVLILLANSRGKSLSQTLGKIGGAGGSKSRISGGPCDFAKSIRRYRNPTTAAASKGLESIGGDPGG